MRFTLKPITREDAYAISRWRYDGPYSIYNGDPNSVDSLLQPHFYYHSVYDERGDLTGYFCFGEDARVPAGRRLGVYERESALDVGLGMRPDLAGRGLGAGFVLAGLSGPSACTSGSTSKRWRASAFARRKMAGSGS